MSTTITDYFDAYARDYRYYKGGAWCYEDGCLYRGLIALYEATGEQRWYDHLIRLVQGQVSEAGELAGYTLTEYNIDNVLPGRTPVYLSQKTGDPRYLIAAKRLERQLQSHPRVKAGPHWHKLRYPHQVWLDGLYMALPFKAELGRLTGNKDLIHQAISEMLTALDLMFDAPSGLYRHGYDEERLQPWADPKTGLSPAHWARAIGWMAMALVDLIEATEGEADQAKLIDKLQALLPVLGGLRTADGRWYQVIDQPALEGNYAESSATAMFAYSFLKAARLGLGSDFATVGLEALASLEKNALLPDASGRTVLQSICCVAGLGGFEGRFRDGSSAYYVSEILKDDDIKGVSPLMTAHAERHLRISQTQPVADVLAG
ncbi:glycoside hydrolase family 88/105 protein [Rhizobium oryzicola]|uniref:Glycoside hydrolase family 88 protein n=1 Tax=Rhizobium oryzicola TaxID=1232668 RepID=A0ABT8T441_9HYPH|nr:glycoside hydrolase family 88 protein [Rhizobium oryzicola]MDO1584946.1 glycoside hydrolase family 88 protein [Rhizobium oryzicola]